MKRIVKRFIDLVRKMSPESQARIAKGAQEMTDAEFKSHISATWVGELVQRAQSLSHDSSSGDVASIAVRCRHLLQQLEQMNERYVCNLCGHPCSLGPERNMGGIVNQTVDGNYDSTPGNGQGALDDCMTYRFSMCEFCLDWLFQQFVVPVTVFSYQGDGGEPFRPAAVRVRDDDWRRQKAAFTQESERRARDRRFQP